MSRVSHVSRERESMVQGVSWSFVLEHPCEPSTNNGNKGDLGVPFGGLLNKY